MRQAAYALKLLQSQGELTIASTGKDPHSGKLVTEEYRVEGPVMLFLTTTAIDIDEELLNRCVVLTINESREQTAAIQQRQRQARTLSGLLANREAEACIQKHRNAQRLLTTPTAAMPGPTPSPIPPMMAPTPTTTTATRSPARAVPSTTPVPTSSSERKKAVPSPNSATARTAAAGNAPTPKAPKPPSPPI